MRPTEKKLSKDEKKAEAAKKKAERDARKAAQKAIDDKIAGREPAAEEGEGDAQDKRAMAKAKKFLRRFTNREKAKAFTQWADITESVMHLKQVGYRWMQRDLAKAFSTWYGSAERSIEQEERQDLAGRFVRLRLLSSARVAVSSAFVVSYSGPRDRRHNEIRTELGAISTLWFSRFVDLGRAGAWENRWGSILIIKEQRQKAG